MGSTVAFDEATLLDEFRAPQRFLQRHNFARGRLRHGYGHRRAWNQFHHSCSTVQGVHTFRDVGRRLCPKSCSATDFDTLFYMLEKVMLHRSMAYNTNEVHDYVCRLGRYASVVSPLQVSATTVLCEYEQQLDFSRSIASRAPNVFGLTSGHRVTKVFSCHSLRESCHTSRIGCGDYSRDVLRSLYFETLPMPKLMTSAIGWVLLI